MELSDFPMKKQIVFGQIWKRLVIIVVDLNYYELILLIITICLNICPRNVDTFYVRLSPYVDSFYVRLSPYVDSFYVRLSPYQK